MDEVENPALPAAGETSPTIRPTTDEEQLETKAELNDVELTALPILPSASAKATRPGLKRENTAPPPNPPPAIPGQPQAHDFSQEAPDSLTLADLKRLRSTFPPAEEPAKRETLKDLGTIYDYEYADAQSLPTELEEWFTYSEKESARLKQCKAAFDETWRNSGQDWLEVTEDARRQYIKDQTCVLTGTKASEEVSTALLSLTYVALGVWEETAGRSEGINLEDLLIDGSRTGSDLNRFRTSNLQIQWIIAMVDTLRACGAISVIYDQLRKACDDAFREAQPETVARTEALPKRGNESTELWCCLTIIYVVLEVARTSAGPQGETLRNAVSSLQPTLVTTSMSMVGQLRWMNNAPVPLTKMLLLAWKSILVSFGGIKDVDRIRMSMKDIQDEKDDRGQPLITASPLDYHLFRQEISSKYPAYQPPPPLFSFEPENNSILPPLKHRRPNSVQADVFAATQPVVGTGSLMHQPVHIATPAPSPPPSPAIPGKAGKKQNYQTNQMFPFLYPPLEESSNNLGGKGTTEQQDTLVGRKWTGSDIPISISEAAELFSKRMRAPRAMKQLWATRVDFMKYERGYKGAEDVEETAEGFEFLPEPAAEETAEQGEPLAQLESDRILSAVDDFYRDSLPHLQSVVIILLKAVLQHVTDLVTRNGGLNGLQAGIQFNDGNGNQNGFSNGNEANPAEGDATEGSIDELDRMRSQEVAAKALSAILLLLLKWFKLNHVLQHEYLTQLLLDSNYVPLVLRLWQTQEVGRACHVNIDREELQFFHLCQTNSRQGAPQPNVQEDNLEESEDEAAPPPIKLKREPPQDAQQSIPTHDATHPPEIDELGYPLTALPQTPITRYSYRNVFSYVNYLRILQKVTQRKTHRALLLVSYKSSNHLRKLLKIPIADLRYYTLKLFKSQVPFCGRKWRQGNMKIITAVWLSVPAGLRDDWLAGGGGNMGGAGIGDVDGTVDDALPLEQSLRALTHWWNVRTYPEAMGLDRSMMDQEIDFFQREIEKMEIARALIMGEEEANEEDTQEPAWGYSQPDGF